MKKVQNIKKSIFLLLFVLFPCFLFANNEFEEWQESQEKEYTSYIKKADKEFISKLQQDWEEFKSKDALYKYKKKKPKTPPSVTPPKKEVVPQKPQADKDEVKTPSPPTVAPIKTPVVPAAPIAPIVPIVLPEGEKGIVSPTKKDAEQLTPTKEKLSPTKEPLDENILAPADLSKYTKLSFNFFGNNIVIYVDKKTVKINLKKSIDNKEIANFWENMSKTNYDYLITQLKQYKDNLNLNDWGYHLLFYETGKKMFSENENLPKLFMWFVSIKNNFLSKVAYKDDDVFILFAYDHNLYGVKYFTIDDTNFYALNFSDKEKEIKNLKTYKEEYSKNLKNINLDIDLYPKFKKVLLKKRKISFKYNEQKYDLEIACNEYVAKFFKKYPQTNFNIYFDAAMNKEVKEKILEPISKIIQGKEKQEQLGIILRLTQKGFDYKTDDEQFGYEKYLLPEESILYPFSDCEDRSFFFAFAVKHLLHMKVVGVHYPNHMATAVLIDENFKADDKWDFVENNNKKYVVCDPTYINANIGMAMPEFKKADYKIVEIR